MSINFKTQTKWINLYTIIKCHIYHTEKNKTNISNIHRRNLNGNQWFPSGRDIRTRSTWFHRWALSNFRRTENPYCIQTDSWIERKGGVQRKNHVNHLMRSMFSWFKNKAKMLPPNLSISTYEHICTYNKYYPIKSNNT